MCVFGAQGDQKVLNPVELDLQVAVSRHVGTELKPESSARTSTLNYRAISLASGTQRQGKLILNVLTAEVH